MSNRDLAEAFSQVVLVNRVAAYCDLSSIVLLVYDYFLSLKLEVELVWGTPWSLGKVLYVLTRYCVFVDCMILSYLHFASGKLVSVRTCSILYQVSGWCIFWGGCLAEIILIFRTWAIWGQKRKIALGLPLLFVVVVAPLTYLTKIGLTAITYATTLPIPVPNAQSCFVIRNDGVTILWDYIFILVFETVILVLTLIKGVQHYRHTTSSLVSTLYQDGILYYVYLLGLSLANVVFLITLDRETGATLVLMQRVFHSILTGRILLHLRMAVVRDRAPEESAPVLSTMFRRAPVFSTIIAGAGTWFEDIDSSGTDGSRTV